MAAGRRGDIGRMFVVLLKFLEVGSRALFVVFTTYSLEVGQAGQFGLLVTLQGLASFAIGYERHIDLMRRMVGREPASFDHAVARALVLFATNYLLCVPLLVLALVVMVKASPAIIAMCVTIAIAEQLMNFAYQMAMVEPRYRSMLVVTVAKNVVIASGVLAGALWGKALTLQFVVGIWAGASLATLLVIALLWTGLRGRSPESAASAGYREIVAGQYRGSWTHFLLGLTAVLTLQSDRLLVGALLSHEQAGIFFRHILLTAMLYQVFNIAFFNRILPTVFASGQQRDSKALEAIVRREFQRVLIFWLLTAICIFGFFVLAPVELILAYRLDLAYFGGLLVVSAIRARADLNGLVFNALHQETFVFRAQVLSFAIGLPIMIGAAVWYDIPGVIAATGVSATAYLILTKIRLVRMTSENSHVD
ncbi:MATE family efflux transporter [Rhizobium sp. CAU 1783]